MTDLLATVSLHNVSGLPEDDVINTFAFPDLTTATDDLDNVESWCNAFYGTEINVASSVTDYSVCDFLSNEMSRTLNPTLRIYEIQPTGTPLGSPVRTSELFDLSASSDTGRLPNEVAVCLSFAADLTNILEEAPDGIDPGTKPDKPRARRRGRVYIGALNGLSIADLDGHARPSAILQETLTGAVLAANADTGSGNARLGVWSRVDNTVRVATKAWVDNAFDTQRRRGVKATGRLVVTLP